jgi:hypothetical protein
VKPSVRSAQEVSWFSMAGDWFSILISDRKDQARDWQSIG